MQFITSFICTKMKLTNILNSEVIAIYNTVSVITFGVQDLHHSPPHKPYADCVTHYAQSSSFYHYHACGLRLVVAFLHSLAKSLYNRDFSVIFQETLT